MPIENVISRPDIAGDNKMSEEDRTLYYRMKNILLCTTPLIADLTNLLLLLMFTCYHSFDYNGFILKFLNKLSLLHLSNTTKFIQ